MSPAVLSLVALIAALGISMTSRVSVGWIAIAFAWLIGAYAGLAPDKVIAGFPASLFVTLVGVTLLFAAAETNGTLEALAHRTVALVRGNARLIPLLFFALTTVLSSVGPGSISSVALVIPLAMVISSRMGVSPFLTSLMVANGANAGNLSPISAVGVIANAGMVKAGLPGNEWKVWAANFLAHALISVAAWAWFTRKAMAPVPVSGSSVGVPPLTRRQWLTTAVIAAWIMGVVIFKLNMGLAAFACVSVMLALGWSDESAAVARVPWGVIMMVSGVSVLIALLEKTGGMDLFSTLLARMASPASINGVIAFVTGLISIWSSTSGVVLPAFLPTVPTLVAKLGGGDPLAVALSINVGSALVDVSPLSTLGALCVATISDPTAARQLFNRLLIWGFSMSIVGALLCQLFAGWFARL